MNSLPYSILVHTFSRYSFAWPGFFKGWRENMNDYPVYWGSDVPGKGIPDGFIPIFSGPGEWSDRLIQLLKQIPTHDVFYLQEDHWATKPVNLNLFYRLFRTMGLLRLQLSPIVRYYTIYGENAPYFFDEKPKSKYLVAHNPGFWDKKFLLSCLEKGENPWLNEYKGTCRLWERSKQIEKKIAIYPVDWYFHAVEHGKLVKTKALV